MNFNQIGNKKNLKSVFMFYAVLVLVAGFLSIQDIHADVGDFIDTITDADGEGGEFNTPIGVAVDSNDRIIVADAFNNRIQIFDSTGAFVDTITNADGAGDTFNFPADIAVDSNNRIIVLDNGNNRIQIFEGFPVESSATLIATLPETPSSTKSSLNSAT